MKRHLWFQYSEELREKVFELYYNEHLETYEIARMLDISEYDVLSILGKN